MHLISGVDVMDPVPSAVPEEPTPPLPALSLPLLCLLLPRLAPELKLLPFTFTLEMCAGNVSLYSEVDRC